MGLSVAKQYTLGKNERLKSRKSIEQLFSEGKKFVVPPFRILYKLLPSPGAPSLLFGTAISSKNFKRAVDRNKIKRLTREAYRLQKLPLQERIAARNGQLQIFFIYTARELPEYSEIYKKMGAALEKLDKITQV
jgi:ribonuclease P protein component